MEGRWWGVGVGVVAAESGSGGWEEDLPAMDVEVPVIGVGVVGLMPVMREPLWIFCKWCCARPRMVLPASGPSVVVVVMSEPSGEVGGGGGTDELDVVDVETAYLCTR
jgi:hypothetical protein